MIFNYKKLFAIVKLYKACGIVDGLKFILRGCMKTLKISYSGILYKSIENDNGLSSLSVTSQEAKDRNNTMSGMTSEKSFLLENN